jgi:hypothetical protein
LNVSETRSPAFRILDEIGKAIGAGNRSDDGCGDMRGLMAEWAGKSEPRVTERGAGFGA